MSNYIAVYVRKMGLRIPKDKLTRLEYYLKVLDAEKKYDYLKWWYSMGDRGKKRPSWNTVEKNLRRPWYWMTRSKDGKYITINLRPWDEKCTLKLYRDGDRYTAPREKYPYSWCITGEQYDRVIEAIDCLLNEFKGSWEYIEHGLDLGYSTDSVLDVKNDMDRYTSYRVLISKEHREVMDMWPERGRSGYSRGRTGKYGWWERGSLPRKELELANTVRKKLNSYLKSTSRLDARKVSDVISGIVKQKKS